MDEGILQEASNPNKRTHSISFKEHTTSVIDYLTLYDSINKNQKLTCK